MPPKPKFTREEVAAAALTLVSEKGMDALTARELGARLGSSPRPIFTLFSGMEEVQRTVRAAALQYFEAFVGRGDTPMPPFKRFGMRMVQFAKEEPKLFQLLFLTENPAVQSFEELFASLGSVAPASLSLLQQEYGLDKETARALFEEIWIYTFGIGALCAARVCRFSDAELSRMLSHAFNGALMLAKSPAEDPAGEAPAP